ncbi:MAG: aldo/keto reductase family protein [Planctomycetes bacterium]|nr:aldo/keto reductase family protein [Planctomycetota bacterium]
MQYRTLGDSGLRVSALGLGSWLTMGTTVDAAGTRQLVQLARDKGVNLFDTADVYNRGEAELALAQALKDVPRHECVIATKCFFPMSKDVNDRGLSRKHIHESIHKSLKRLGTDYVDLYQCHRFDPEVPLAETARAMDDLIRRGLVLYWGVSQWPADRIAEVVELCRHAGFAAPISNQPLYNLFDREIELAVLPTSARHGVGQLVYSPLAQGVLTGKYAPGQAPPAGSRATETAGGEFIARYMTEKRLQVAAQLTAIAADNDLTATQIALAFCMRDERISSVLVGARSEAQLKENVGALNILLSPALLAELDRLFPIAVAEQ